MFNLEIFALGYFIGGAFPALRGCKGGASLNCIKMVVTMNPCPCGYYGNITNYWTIVNKVDRKNRKIK